jgi:hypothetical protein
MERIIRDYLLAKEEEQKAKEKRLKYEKAILQLVDNQQVEGSKTVIVNPTIKVTVINQLKRDVDLDKYRDTFFPAHCCFIVPKPEIDLKILRVAEKLYPKEVASCITTKSMKPILKIKQFETGVMIDEII